MRRMPCAVAVAGALVVLSGCAAPEPPDETEVAAWLAQQDGHDDPRTLARFSGGPSLLDDDDGDDGDAGAPEGITVDFAEAVSVSGVEFSCFGEETMSVEVRMSGETGAWAERLDDLRCDESPHLVAEGAATAPVTRVTGNGLSANGFGAWAAVVLGDE